MNTAKDVDALIEQLKDSPTSESAWQIACACVGWSYVYSAWGALCTPSERRKRYGMTGVENIKKKCQNFDGTGTCSGCQWYPGGERTRCYDCRGFTDWVLRSAGIIDLYGDTCGVQWNHKENWDAQGSIDTIPDDVLVCLYVCKDGKFTHTGLGYKGSTCECSSGVQYALKRAKKWTHWAVPRGLGGNIPDRKPTLRRGDKGAYVTLLQTELVQRGYDVGTSGIDGDFGRATEAAVKAFQKDAGLVVDGVCGQKTWDALESEAPILYTVTIPGLTRIKAENLVAEYSGATMREEGR